MDLLWPALGISVIVAFVFYVLATHWGRTLRHQAWTIRRLSERLQTLEEVDNPRFRERLSQSAPVPLEQVFTFSFRLSDRFWRKTLTLSDQDWSFVRGFGSFVGSVKLERWRSHIAATITEVLPECKTAAWQSRSLDYFAGPAGRAEALTLWEIPLARPSNGTRPPALELVLRGNAVELSARQSPAAGSEPEETTFFRVPLDSARLTEFRSHDPAEPANGNGNGNATGNGAGSWRAFYAWGDENVGIEWQMRVVDLNLKTEWEHWKILESQGPPAIP